MCVQFRMILRDLCEVSKNYRQVAQETMCIKQSKNQCLALASVSKIVRGKFHSKCETISFKMQGNAFKIRGLFHSNCEANFILKIIAKIAGKIAQETHKVQMYILIVGMNCLSLRPFIHNKLGPVVQKQVSLTLG